MNRERLVGIGALIATIGIIFGLHQVMDYFPDGLLKELFDLATRALGIFVTYWSALTLVRGTYPSRITVIQALIFSMIAALILKRVTLTNLMK